MNAAKDILWNVNSEEINNFTILDDPMRTELNMQARQPLTLYPQWRVDLSLDKIYPGGVSSITVGIWADTRTINYAQELSYGGSIPEFPSTTILPLVLSTVLNILIFRKKLVKSSKK